MSQKNQHGQREKNNPMKMDANTAGLKSNQCYSLKYVFAKKPTDGKSTEILKTFLKAIWRNTTFSIKPVDNRNF